MALLIDTDVLIGRERDQKTIDSVISAEDAAISVVTVSELLHGVHRATGARRAKRSAFVESLLASIEALPITETIARVHADIWAELAENGKRVGAHDMWIAATAMTFGFGVATGNAHEFEQIKGLRVVPVG